MFYKFTFLLFVMKCVKSFTYHGESRELTAVPSGIPQTTTRLLLTENHIASVDANRISYLSSLKYLSLESNKLELFPDLCSLGLTLQKLYIGYNPIKVINPSYISCFQRLHLLYLESIHISYFPDLSSIGNTLEDLSFSPKDAVPITYADLEHLEKLKYLLLEKAKLTQFPDVRPVGDTLLLLRIPGNELQSAPQHILNSLTALDTFTANDNKYTEIPDLCGLKYTLLRLIISNNPITKINPSYIYCLINLIELRFGSSSLISIDDLDLSLLKDTLKYLKIEDTSLLTLPDMRNLKNIDTLYLNRNQNLSEFSKDFFQGWDSLHYLRMKNNEIDKIPDFYHVSNTILSLDLTQTKIKQLSAGNIAVLHAMTYYFIRDATFAVPHIPSPCTVDHSNLNIRVEGVNVDLCACRHVWIKMAEELGANVGIDSIQCSGKDWRSASSNYLYNLCDQSLPDTQNVRAIRITRSQMCVFPVKEIVSEITLFKCMESCMLTAGCYTFNFKNLRNQNEAKYGDYVIIAPGNSGNSLPTGIDYTGWDLYELIGKELI